MLLISGGHINGKVGDYSLTCTTCEQELMKNSTNRKLIKVLSIVKLKLVETEESVNHGMSNSAPVLKPFRN